MRRPTFALPIALVVVLLLAGAVLDLPGRWTRFGAIDDCLDAGGAWDHATGSCRMD